MSRREIARSFGIKAGNRAELRSLLKELESERRAHGRGPSAALSSPCAVEAVAIDLDGEVLARPLEWRVDSPPPAIYLVPGRGERRSAALGERFLVQLRANPDGSYDALPVRRLGPAPRRVLGVFERGPGGGRIRPTNRRARADLIVPPGETGGAEP
ncbi:MAG: ribonuclease R, partial [Alphaproteobacteria bacterium]